MCMCVCNVTQQRMLLFTQLLLIGTDRGLFAMQFTTNIQHRSLTRVSGIDGTVHAIDGHADPGLAFFVVGTFIVIQLGLLTWYRQLRGKI